MITEDGMKTICEFVGVYHFRTVKCECDGRCRCYAREGTKLDYNLLMKAVEKINKEIPQTFILMLGNCICVEEHKPDQERTYFELTDHPTTEEALATAILWVLKEIG